MPLRPKGSALRWLLRVAAHLLLVDRHVRLAALRALARGGESAEW